MKETKTTRRSAVKIIASSVTALAAYNAFPTKWGTPIVKQVFSPAHAATSGTGGAPAGADFTIDAGGATTASTNLSSKLTGGNGPLVANFGSHGVISGDIVISAASITANTATITISGGTGVGFIDYTVTDGVTTSLTYRITVVNLGAILAGIPLGESFTLDAGGSYTVSSDLTSRLSGGSGPLVANLDSYSVVIGSSITIEDANIVGNTLSITVSGSSGAVSVQYTVSDGAITSIPYNIEITNLDGTAFGG